MTYRERRARRAERLREWADKREAKSAAGARYDRAGYILETAAEAFAKHRTEDPHCTCNDCIDHHARSLAV